MKSMTGYAKRQYSKDGRQFTIEIKTLNSKTLDLNMKYPSAFRFCENEMRQQLNQLQRGKIDLYITENRLSGADAHFNEELFVSRYNALVALQGKLGCEAPHLFEQLAAQPDLWQKEEGDDEEEKVGKELIRQIEECVKEVDQFRADEGSVLQKDIALHVDNIEAKLKAIEAYEKERIETARQRIMRYFEEFAIKDVDKNRFEQELIYYLEKLDITEEKVRLQKHIDYFRATMNDEACGKKLGFTAQEMGREINTTGSKANHAAMQTIVVEMKDELEKIKEQLGNIL